MSIYKNFNNYILRIPTWSLDNLKTPNLCINSFNNNKEFLQAVRLASPSLYTEFKKWQNNELNNEKDIDRLFNSLLKYYVRSSMRCTPFGLFAGVSIGSFQETNNIEIYPPEKHIPHTRLDMNYLCSLITKIELDPDIQSNTNYYKNTSIYQLDNKIRYIESSYTGTKRSHQISSVDNNEYLKLILSTAEHGATKNTLINKITNKDIDYNDAENYINLLIENQLLISDIAPPVTGLELHDFLLNKINNLGLDNSIIKTLEIVIDELNKLDRLKFGKGINKYSEMQETLARINNEFNEKYLFQTDLVTSSKSNYLNSNIITSINSGIKIFNKLTSNHIENSLTKFMDAFLERYEEREIPLSIALDVETGIGYIQNKSSDDNPLVDNLVIPSNQNIEYLNKINWGAKQSFILKKYNEAILNNSKEIEITDEDVVSFKENWDDLPSTIATKVQIVNFNDKETILMNYIGGSSAINLLGRFAHADDEIHKFINEIANKEEELNPNVVLAEIVHLPDSRVGNVLARPVFRKYEIPYLAKSTLDAKYQITIDDLMISVRNNRIILRSKKLNKEVKPHLSNAHNYSYNSLPIYHFLADMQTQGLRGILQFNYGPLENEFNFLPRVRYKNIIFSPATWIIQKKEIENLIKIKTDIELIEETSKLIIKRRINKHVVLEEGDNILFIDLSEPNYIKMLLSLVKNKPYFKLKEFFFTGINEVVKDVNDKFYANEVIISFYKENANKANL